MTDQQKAAEGRVDVGFLIEDESSDFEGRAWPFGSAFGYSAQRIICPEHGIPDCSPLLNGCSRVIRMANTAPEIVCLCGSTRFKDEINRVNAELTLAGKIVLSMGVFGHVDMPDYDWQTELKRALDDLHKRKIDLCDSVLVVNPGGYIGESTRSEIEYAKRVGKPISYTSGEPNG